MLALKGNQSNLSAQVAAVFEQALDAGYEGYDVDYYETKEPSRDRFEVRRHWTLSVSDTPINTQPWKGLNIIGMVESQRTIKDETSIDYHY